jgi:hypothetical protein
MRHSASPQLRRAPGACAHRWLKGWDACVFGTAGSEAASKQGGAAGAGAGARGPARPEQRILLLSGAPGALAAQA